MNLELLHRNLRGIELDPFERMHKIPDILKLVLTETNELVNRNKKIREASARPGQRNMSEPEKKSAKTSKKKRPPKKRTKHKAKDVLLHAPLLSLPSSRATSLGPSPSPTPPPSSRAESPLPDRPDVADQESCVHLTPPLPDLSTSALDAHVPREERFRMPEEFKNTCKRCSRRKEEEWCIRRVPVQELVDYKNYEGCIITTAPEGDRLEPKVSQKHQSCFLLLTVVDRSSEAKSFQSCATFTPTTWVSVKLKPVQMFTNGANVMLRYL